MPNLVGDPVKQRFSASMGKAQGTGRGLGGWGKKVTPLVLIGRVDFSLGKIIHYSINTGLVPLAREGLVPVLRENLIWLKRQAQENDEKKNAKKF